MTLTTLFFFLSQKNCQCDGLKFFIICRCGRWPPWTNAVPLSLLFSPNYCCPRPWEGSWLTHWVLSHGFDPPLWPRPSVSVGAVMRKMPAGSPLRRPARVIVHAHEFGRQCFGVSLSYVWPHSSISDHAGGWWKPDKRDKYIFGNVKRAGYKPVLFCCLPAQLGWRDTGNTVFILWANPFRQSSNPSKRGAHCNTSQRSALSNDDCLQFDI